MEKDEVNNFLNSVKKNSVIGLEGYSGSGKTTLINELKEKRDDILFIHMDDYVSWFVDLETSQKSPELKVVFNNSEKLKELRELIQKREKTILIEGVFLLHKSVFGDLLDKLIYIDINFDLADQRREERERKRWGEKYIHSDSPKSFTGGFALEYRKYVDIYKPREKADLVVKK